jgi:hypothetical protein
MQHAVFALFLLATATAFALLEIQIEGRHGWAGSLPTWRIYNRWTRRLWKKPLTGYHLYAQVFVFLCAHAPFGVGLARWGPAAELRVLSFVVLF